MGYFFDPTYILVVIGALLCMAASAKVRITFFKYSGYQSKCGMTGAEMAQRVLHLAGITDVQVDRVEGQLSDHYDPRTKTVRLSEVVYGSSSIAAVSVAAHECGHAIQHNRSYFPLILRSSLVPVANLGSNMAWPLIIIGLMINSNTGLLLIQIGILAFSASVLFQLVTLPVEFDASRRALVMMEDNRLVPDEEVEYAGKVLGAAALTYVASAAASILQLLRLILLTRNSRDD